MIVTEYFTYFSELVPQYGYGVIFFAMLLENTFALGLLLPGLLVMIMGGYYAGLGELNVVIVIAVSFLGTILGDNISYALGRYGFIKIPLIKRFSGKFDALHMAVKESNDRFLYLFHFPVFSRIVIPALLGIVKFNIRKWLTIDVIGASIFVISLSTVGYVIGITTKKLDDAINISQYIQWAVIIILVLWLISVIKSLRKIVR